MKLTLGESTMLKKIGFVLALLLGLIVVPTLAQDQMGMDKNSASLLGRYQFIKGEVNSDNRAITLPLYQGHLKDGSPVWYILTDVSDHAAAEQWGINYAAILAGAEGQTRTASADSAGQWVFDVGRVDFSPEHSVVPGKAPDLFPPAEVHAGSVGDADYTPLVSVNGVIFNAPIVAFGVTVDQINFCDGSPDHKLVHDKVISICPSKSQVAIALTQGFAFGRQVFYISTEANVDVAAALEAATLTPRLDKIANQSAPLFLALNGPTGKDNPVRQGVLSALAGEGSPRNLLSVLPGLSDGYSPIWGVNIYKWTDSAIKDGTRTQLIDTAYQFSLFRSAGLITSPDGGEIVSSGPLVNCPVIFRAQ
jgi:hypothetical protein